MSSKIKANNEFEPFLNESQTYVWEWYIPEHKVRFGIPSLNGLWLDDKDKNIKLSTMLERVHPDDVDKILVRKNSPLYRTDKMFEVDLRLNVAAVLQPDGKSSNNYEWYGFRGKIVNRDANGKPVYLRGVAINIDRRVRVQKQLFEKKNRMLQEQRQQTEYCAGVIEEMKSFLAMLAGHADEIISGGGTQSREAYLMQINMIKEQGMHLMELSDRVRHLTNASIEEAGQKIQHVSLWEHLAELQQIYSLKVQGKSKLYFSNLYDSVAIDIDVKLLDLLLENVFNCQLRNTQKGYLTVNYSLINDNFVQFSVSCTDSNVQVGNMDLVLTESGMGLSVCRLLAKRLYGDVEVRQTEDRRLHYLITLPVHAKQYEASDYKSDSAEGMSDVFDELEAEMEVTGDDREEALELSRMQVSVLIGTSANTDIFQHQHLFNMKVAANTDNVMRLFKEQDPDIVFVDYNLPGQLQIDDMIAQMHALHPETPIVVTAQYATRPLHRRVTGEGARYLLTNPLSLRKINMMIKKYLK
ncbi:MAG: hybrid sensor histidine kinase/response regulator [Bacteroidales bacterium]|nr:hybrid sensor histidine kinase/response regulator [Bacteroidales bacterium]